MTTKERVSSRLFMGMQVICLISVFHNKLAEMVWFKEKLLYLTGQETGKSNVKVLVDSAVMSYLVQALVSA